jgi:hypothetical protein
LIATRIRTPFSRHWRLCRQASSMTQLPIAPIRPKRSAIGMKVLGRSRPRVGCFQRSSASTGGDLAALGVDLRLVEELELLGGDGLPQVAQELELGFGVGVHRARVEAELRAARALRRVHRRVGAGDQLGVAAAVGVDGDADRARDHHLAALGLVRLREALDQAVGDVGDALLRRHVAEQEQELVAADAGDDVLAARHRLQALADLLEDDVADRVAVGVVDRLEAVEVDEEQGEPAGVGVGLGRCGGEAVLEVDARRQLGQAVDGRRGADRAPRRLVVVRAGAVQRLEHRQAHADQRADEDGFGPRGHRRQGRSRPRPTPPASAARRRAGRRRCGWRAASCSA